MWPTTIEETSEYTAVRMTVSLNQPFTKKMTKHLLSYFKMKDELQFFCQMKQVQANDTHKTLGMRPWEGKIYVVRLPSEEETSRKHTQTAARHKAAPPRKAGDHPVTMHQQMDYLTRRALGLVQLGMQTLQIMSLPLARSDEFMESDDLFDDSAEGEQEKQFPWVVHGDTTFTEQRANGNGQNKGGCELAKPQLHMWVGSGVAADKMKQVLSEVTTCEICLRTSFNSYGAVFDSTGMPQQQSRKTKAQKQAEKLEK